MAARFIQLLCSVCMLQLFCSLKGATDEVHEGVVYTDLHKTVKKGDEIVLKCKFYETPIVLYWKKRDAQDRGTNLITWVEEGEISGSCANNKACHMSSNYSLVIREARIEDQGRYTCRVTINVGILIYNYTDVEIYAPPKDPYPVIDKCAEKESSGFNSTYSCRILTNTTIILTCSATNYYPELDLAFLHGSRKMTNMMPSEKMNSDGTKNKSISIKASASETTYVCIALGIPGSNDRRAATILVESSSVMLTTKAKEGSFTPFTTEKIVVSILVILLLGAAVVIAFLGRRHQRLKRRMTTLIEEIVPLERMTIITENEVEGWVDRLTKNHMKPLAHCLDIDEDTMKVINEANKDTIFNTEAMVNEWIRQGKFSIYSMRKRLNEAIDTIRQHDITSGNGDLHSSEEFIENEFQRVAFYLSAPELKELFGNDVDPQKAIPAYAENWKASNPEQDFREELREMLNPVQLQDLIPYRLGSKVYLCELLDVAFRLLLNDVYPFAKALGISKEKLMKYRVPYAPDHLTKGTTAALIKFSNTHNDDRKEVCATLSKAGYKNIAQLLEYGHETSLADDLVVASKARGTEAHMKISKNLKISPRGNIMAVLKDWKETVHPPSYNKRTSLADAVFPVLGKDVAVPILTRKYREDGSDSSEIITTISTTIEKILGYVVQAERVTTSSQGADLIDDSAENGTDNLGQDEQVDALTISQILGVSILDPPQYSSIRQVLATWEEIIRKKPLSKGDRRELSNNLLRAGFKQFALEIMTGFVSRP